MEEEKKEVETVQEPVSTQEVVKPKKNVLLFVIVSLIVLIGIGVLLFILLNNGDKKDNKPKENEQKEEEKKEEKEEETKEETKGNTISLSSIDTSKKLNARKFDPQEMKVLTADRKREFGNGSVADIKINGTTVDITYTIEKDKVYKRTYQNINKIYYYEDNDCADYLFLFLMSDESIMPIRLGVEYSEEISLYPKDPMNNGYEKLYYDFLSGSTCGAIYEEYGYKDGKYYDIYTNEAYLDNTYYYFDGSFYIKVDRTYEFPGNTTGTAKIIINDFVSGTPNAIIDSNNKLVYLEENIPEGVKEAEVTKIRIDNNNENDVHDVYVEYKDGTTAKLSYVTVEY